MSTLPSVPPPGNPSSPDADHLRILSIFYYVLAALQVLGGCFPMIYVGMGMLFAGAGAASGNADGAGAVGVGMFFVCFGGFIVLIAWGIAFLNYTVARSLVARRKLTLCYIMAALICLAFPLGTALGVFTFIVLSRPSVKASFH